MNNISYLPFIKGELKSSIDYIRKEFNDFEVDSSFLSFNLKKAIFFKLLATKGYDKEHSIILVSEFLYLIKYYCSRDYRAFSLSERTIIENLLKIITKSNTRESTTELIAKANLPDTKKSQVMSIFKEDSNIIHHSLLFKDSDTISILLSDVLKKSSEFTTTDKRNTVIRKNLNVINILIHHLILTSENELRLAFSREIDVLNFLTNSKI